MSERLAWRLDAKTRAVIWRGWALGVRFYLLSWQFGIAFHHGFISDSVEVMVGPFILYAQRDAIGGER